MLEQLDENGDIVARKNKACLKQFGAKPPQKFDLFGEAELIQAVHHCIRSTVNGAVGMWINSARHS